MEMKNRCFVSELENEKLRAPELQVCWGSWFQADAYNEVAPGC